MISPVEIWFKVGMDLYQKCVYREVANAKPYWFRDSAFQYIPTKHRCSSSRHHEKSPLMHKICNKNAQFL